MRKWYPWILVALAVAFSLAMYSRLPDPIPTRWNLQGEPSDFTSRAWGVWLMPVMLLVMAVVLPRLPAIDPRRENYDKFRPTYDLTINAIMTFILLMHVATIGAGVGWPVRIERITPALVGALFVLIGNLMPRARPNWLFGIRTPWTLTNDRVWERTHRLGGFTFVIAGLVLMACAFAPPPVAMPAFIVATVVASVVPLVYSYFAWRQETNRAQNS